MGVVGTILQVLAFVLLLPLVVVIMFPEWLLYWWIEKKSKNKRSK